MHSYKLVAPENYIKSYRFNPKSVRPFEDYTLITFGGLLQGITDECNEFLQDLITDDVLKLREPILVNQDGIILDGNLRHKILTQIISLGIKNLTVERIPIRLVETQKSDLYLNQISNNQGAPIPLRKKIAVIEAAINDAGLETVQAYNKSQFKRYVKILDDYKKLPDWLKDEGDLYNVSVTTLIRFGKSNGDQTDWNKIKRLALRDCVTVFKVSSKHVDSYQTTKRDKHPRNDTEVGNQGLETAFDFDTVIPGKLAEIKATLEKLDPVLFAEKYLPICTDKERFYTDLDRLNHILSSF